MAFFTISLLALVISCLLAMLHISYARNCELRFQLKRERRKSEEMLQAEQAYRAAMVDAVVEVVGDENLQRIILKR